MKRLKVRKQRGFSLVELMIVVAIIAILAAIAIPAFMRFAMKAKTAEATGNLNAIRTCLVSYKAENDVFLVCPVTPAAGGNDATADAWPAPKVDGVDQFGLIGFEPDGAVRYKYEAGPGTGAAAAVLGEFTTAFEIIATGNLDENATPATYTVDSGLPGYPKPVQDPPGEY